MPKSKIPKPFSGRKFDGVLAQPIDKPSLLVYGFMTRLKGKEIPAELVRLHRLYVDEQTNERLRALAVSYGIPMGLKGARPRDWERQLLLKLAGDFVVGLTFAQDNLKPKKGAKIKPPDHDLAIRVFEVMKTAKTAANACRFISKDKTKPWYGKSQKSLLEQFNRMKASLKKQSLEPPSLTPFESWLQKQQRLPNK